MVEEWYKTWFSSKYYLELYKHRDDKDAENLINLIQKNINLPLNSKVLDICCGAGRHSLEFAKRGFDVTGFDLSRFLISQAKTNSEKVKRKNLKVKFFIKDMRNFNFKHTFDLAINLFTSFGYFENDEENFRLFENVILSLKRTGYFIFDYLNGKYIKNHLKISNNSVILGKKVIQKRRIENGFVIKDILISKGKDELFFTERLKLYSMNDFKKVYKKFGLKIIKTFGDYSGNGFDDVNSERIIIIAKKI